MVSSRTRRTRILHDLFREAPSLHSTIVTVSRAEAARWGSTRHLIFVSTRDDSYAAAWFQGGVWHVGRIRLTGPDSVMSPTRVAAADHDVVGALLREVDERAESSPVVPVVEARRPSRIRIGQFA